MGQMATKAEVRRLFYWWKLDEDVDALVASCLHCWSAHHPREIPRPLGPTKIASGPFEIVQMDLCKVYDHARVHDASTAQGLSRAAPYVLVIKDKFSRLVMLKECEASCAMPTRMDRAIRHTGHVVDGWRPAFY